MLPEDASASMSPSPSTSAAKTPVAMSAIAIVWIVQPGGEAPSFSYQATLSCISALASTSISPSPSTSAANTEFAPFMLKSMVLVVNPGGDPPLFSYQAILRSKDEAERTSVSPSPSTSAAKTDRAPFASVAITRAVNWGDVAPSLSYQAIVSPRNEAERTSMSPSPSTSAAK